MLDGTNYQIPNQYDDRDLQNTENGNPNITQVKSNDNTDYGQIWQRIRKDYIKENENVVKDSNRSYIIPAGADMGAYMQMIQKQKLIERNRTYYRKEIVTEDTSEQNKVLQNPGQDQNTGAKLGAFIQMIQKRNRQKKLEKSEAAYGKEIGVEKIGLKQEINYKAIEQIRDENDTKATNESNFWKRAPIFLYLKDFDQIEEDIECKQDIIHKHVGFNDFQDTEKFKNAQNLEAFKISQNQLQKIYIKNGEIWNEIKNKNEERKIVGSYYTPVGADLDSHMQIIQRKASNSQEFGTVGNLQERNILQNHPKADNNDFKQIADFKTEHEDADTESYCKTRIQMNKKDIDYGKIWQEIRYKENKTKDADYNYIPAGTDMGAYIQMIQKRNKQNKQR